MTRALLALAALAGLAHPAAADTGGSRPPARVPNIVFILADDRDYSVVSVRRNTSIALLLSAD
jgi:hypothetical protein